MAKGGAGWPEVVAMVEEDVGLLEMVVVVEGDTDRPQMVVVVEEDVPGPPPASCSVHDNFRPAAGQRTTWPRILSLTLGLFSSLFRHHNNLR